MQKNIESKTSVKVRRNKKKVSKVLTIDTLFN